MPFRAVFVPLLLYLALGMMSLARGADIALVLSDSGGAYGDFASAFQQFAANPPWRVRWVGTAENLDSAAFRADLIVAVGNDATRTSLRRSDGRPVVATLLPRQAYDRALAETPSRPRGVTAIYLDQPISRLLAFSHYLLPDRHRAGVLVGSDTRPLLAQARQAASAAGMTLETEEAEPDTALVPAMNQLLGRSDLLLALPDSAVYRRDNIRVILLTSYRYQKPVIAFSQAFVTAGALAALYSSPAQVARQTADTIRQLNPDAINLPPPQGPTLFSIAINRNVAQAFGLSLPDEATIRRALNADKETR